MIQIPATALPISHLNNSFSDVHDTSKLKFTFFAVTNFDLSVFKYLNQCYSKKEGAGMYRGLLLSSVITMEHMFLDLPYLEVRAFPFTTKVFSKVICIRWG